ncbi:hypothetical protein LEMLEM_LOCUS21598 [Lemmus lemmus]
MCRPYGEALAEGILKLHLSLQDWGTLNRFRWTVPYSRPPDAVGPTSFNKGLRQEALESLRRRVPLSTALNSEQLSAGLI